MKKRGVISVIVPVYNVEKYLGECIESIIKQTYKNLEIILIDDESPDSCGSICDRYAEIDDRIIVLHQKNGGAAAARNAGLRIATGEYITFVDSDDYLEPDAYEKMLSVLKENDADIVHGNFKNIYVNKNIIHDVSCDICHFSTTEYLIRFLSDWTCGLSVIKLFKNNVLSNVFYEEGHLIDDEFFTYQGVMNAKKIVCIPTVVYNYRQRASSVMKNISTTERKNFDKLDFQKKRRENVAARFPELKTQYEIHYVDYLLWLAGSEQATKNLNKEIKKNLIDLLVHGKTEFWKREHWKRLARIFCFLLQPIEKTIKNQGKSADGSPYEFFE